MEKFLEKNKLLKFTQEIENLNRSISMKEIESTINHFETRKHQVHMDSLVNPDKY